MNTPSAEEIVQRADRAERSGQMGEARLLWDMLAANHPKHPRALYIQAQRHIERGQPLEALPLLAQSEAIDQSFAEAPMHAALAYRMSGDNIAALEAIDRALSIDPYYFMALLSKGAILETLGHKKLAARTFANALKIAPAPERLAPAQRGAYEHARRAVSDNNTALSEYLREQTANVRARFKGERLERFDESLNILAGVQKRFQQDPILLYYPRLPAIPFFDRDHFPWMAQIEAATETIQSELAGVMAQDRAQFAPYIQLPPEAPVNQWTELNHSPSWSTYFLWRDGVRQDANCARCPKTEALLRSLPMAHQPGYAPTAMFSVLQPHTHIPPHTGSANTRLIAHLPLILPEKCRFRVGAEMRDWRMGEGWVFDDTIEHEAWNESDQVRVILIFDVWNPLLSEAERTLVNTMMEALNTYNAQDL